MALCTEGQRLLYRYSQSLDGPKASEGGLMKLCGVGMEQLGNILVEIMMLWEEDN